jgi:hypothetical protein
MKKLLMTSYLAAAILDEGLFPPPTFRASRARSLIDQRLAA